MTKMSEKYIVNGMMMKCCICLHFVCWLEVQSFNIHINAKFSFVTYDVICMSHSLSFVSIRFLFIFHRLSFLWCEHPESSKIIMLIVEVETSEIIEAGVEKVENDCSSIFFLTTPQIIENVLQRNNKKSFPFDVLNMKFSTANKHKMTQWIISQVKWNRFRRRMWRGREKLWKQFLCFINGYNYHSLDAINNKQCRET